MRPVIRDSKVRPLTVAADRSRFKQSPLVGQDAAVLRAVGKSTYTSRLSLIRVSVRLICCQQGLRLFPDPTKAPPKKRDLRMANIASARKRARQAVKQNAHNSSLRSRLRTAIKAVRKAVATGDKAAAAARFQASTSVIDSIADKNIIHKNAAARHKSRLAAAVKRMA
jgi:small subunit ribosomal protein S20